jgi:hypothetical protein
MATPQLIYTPAYPVEAKVATDKEVAVGDLVGMAAGTLVKASDTSWNNDLLTTQEDFAAIFLGVSAQTKAEDVARVPGNSDDNLIRVDTAGDWEFDCASATIGMGAKLGAAKASGNALEDQKVVAVAPTNAAIGVCVKEIISKTRVRLRLLSNLVPLARPIY